MSPVKLFGYLLARVVCTQKVIDDGDGDHAHAIFVALEANLVGSLAALELDALEESARAI
jgi:hypothetical protein